MGADGELVRGGREIEASEATIVHQIFTQFANGTSPRAIARRLNGEGSRGPGGRTWQDTTIRGHAGRGTGILRNELYVGRLVRNRQHFVKDPESGKRQARPNPPSAWIIEDVPELRIIEDGLWNQVASRLSEIASSPASTKLRESGFWDKRRSKHILTGLVVCGCCQQPLASVGKDYLRCSRAHRNDLCINKAGIRRPVLEDIVITALQQNLMQLDPVAAFIAEFHAKVNRSRGDAEQERRGLSKRRTEVEKQLDGLITAISQGLRSSGLQARLDALETEKATIARMLAQPRPPPFACIPI